MQPADIGKPVPFGNLTYVIRINQVKEASLVPLESVSQEIEKELIEKAKIAAEKRLVRALKKVAVAKVYLDPSFD